MTGLNPLRTKSGLASLEANGLNPLGTKTSLASSEADDTYLSDWESDWMSGVVREGVLSVLSLDFFNVPS